jgi:hypothetical protein
MSGHIRYTAWYDPDFDIEGADYSHQEDPNKLEMFIRDLTADIDQNGMRNPVQVVIKQGKAHFHPGKCRVKAMKRLGHTRIPAVVVNYDWPGFLWQRIPPGCTALGKPSQVQKYFDNDTVVQMDHRFLQIKKKQRENHERRKSPKTAHVHD